LKPITNSDTIRICSWRELTFAAPLSWHAHEVPKSTVREGLNVSRASGALKASDGFDVLGEWQEIECGERNEA
jgi:hypothetical protein